jgi:type I restriction enzyme R subunit
VSAFVAESAVEEACLELFAQLGWHVLYGPDIAPDMPKAERGSYRDVLLHARLQEAIRRLNPELLATEVDDVVAALRRPESADLMTENWRAYRLLTGGVAVGRRGEDGQLRHVHARLIDFDDAAINDFVVINQFTVEGDRRTRRADVVVFVNGIPMAVIELKAPGEAGATLHAAFDQLRTYAQQVPALLTYAAVSIISTGIQARMGPFAVHLDRWAPWKTIDGRPEPSGKTELEVLVRGVFEKSRFLDLVRWFVTYSDERSGLTKRVARYHQFHAVNRAIDSTVAAIERGDGRAGVVWHTQGSGKSLEMVFYVTKLIAHPALRNPTVVVLTDRNDLDDQLFGEWFAPARTLPERPVRAEEDKREWLRETLSSKASGGIVFSTMQTFGLTKAERDANRPFPTLSERSNIVVIADEAHRTQYDLIDGLARNLRDALPKAAFVGFTGTPIEGADRDTRAIFGDYIDIYDLTQAIEDEATVKVYYEPRLVRVELPEDVRQGLDREFEEATERAEVEERERLKSRWARVEAIVGSDKRLAQVAADIVGHWEKRRAAEVGKGLIVCMSRRICVRLYDEIIKLRSDWHSTDDDKGKIKVVITGEASEGPEINAHVRTREQLRRLKDRAKDPDDALELVIVRDMWLTGFDSPPLHTMYVDKPMKGAGLMQAIARVNRAFRDKPGGLVVDYIGIAESLTAALADYTDRDRAGKQAGAPVEEALALLEEHHEVCCDLLFGCPWREALESASEWARVEAITAAIDHLLSGDLELPERFLRHSRMAHQSFALAVSSVEAMRFREDLAFFQAVSVELRKVHAEGSGVAGGELEWETALRQVVSEAVASTGVVDIYAAAGLERPDLSLIDEDFARRAIKDPHPNLQIALLRRLLANHVRAVGKRNVVAERKFSEMLERAMKAYTNRSLTAAEVIAELVNMAQQLKLELDRGGQLGMSADELAFYDAVCQNDSAILEMGDEVLRHIASELVQVVRSSATIDWDRKEQVRASLRRNIRRLLAKYHYPPDRQESAVELVMRQAEVLAGEAAVGDEVADGVELHRRAPA